MPLSVLHLKSWVGTPTIFVVDCSGAGVLIPHFVSSLGPQSDDGERIESDAPPDDGQGGAQGIATGEGAQRPATGGGAQESEAGGGAQEAGMGEAGHAQNESGE